MNGLRVFLRVTGTAPVLAGLPAVARVAHAFAREPSVGAVRIESPPGAFDEHGRRALARLGCATGSPSDLRAERSSGGVLVVGPDGIPSIPDLLRFCASSRDSKPAAWRWRGRAVAIFFPGGDVPEGLVAPGEGLFGARADAPDIVSVAAPDGAWIPLTNEVERREAERRLLASLPRATDGYLSRLDRRVSIPLSRLLLRARATPNPITAASLVVGLAGSALVAAPKHWLCVAGVLLLWFSAILDGCDGEVARLTLRASARGRQFDLAVDHVVNLSALLAVAWHVHAVRPELPIAWPAALLGVGVLMSMVAIPLLLGRSSASDRSRIDGVFERVASRDFVYLLIPLAAIDRLEWFLFAAAAGANVFWISIVILLQRWPRRKRPANDARCDAPELSPALAAGARAEERS